jgi:hypothetical protein
MEWNFIFQTSVVTRCRKRDGDNSGFRVINVSSWPFTTDFDSIEFVALWSV